MSALFIALFFPCGYSLDIWPPVQAYAASGQPQPVSSSIRFDVEPLGSMLGADGTAFLTRASERYQKILADVSLGSKSVPASGDTLEVVQLALRNGFQSELIPNSRSMYNYTLSVSGSTATLEGSSAFGLVYAMETFTQLVSRDPQTGLLSLPYSLLTIEDEPDYQWRGLMVDSGRRFVNVQLLKNLMDTMVANKLNVLHLHASDQCRFGVESKLFPNLTAGLTGDFGGFYTQSDIKDLISYGSDRGIRVVPEFDVPGHSRGWKGLIGQGLQYCNPQDPTFTQMYGTEATYNLVHQVLQEMSGLFVDEVFNIGCDETGVVGPCSLNSTFMFERHVLSFIEQDLNKTAAGWEEVQFDAGAATGKTIVNAWARHTAADVINTGHRAIESKNSAFYFTSAAPGGPDGWKRCWYDIATNVNSTGKPLLLGGEMSMWTDTYCITDQCGAAQGKAPVGHSLFAPDTDSRFSRSLGGMIWPRGYVAAAAFWNYDSKVDPTSPGFVSAIWSLNDKLAARGAFVCPTNCSCDQLSACGKPY